MCFPIAFRRKSLDDRDLFVIELGFQFFCGNCAIDRSHLNLVLSLFTPSAKELRDNQRQISQCPCVSIRVVYQKLPTIVPNQDPRTGLVYRKTCTEIVYRALGNSCSPTAPGFSQARSRAPTRA